MRIAVNIQCLAKEEWSSLETYANELMQHIIKAHSQHEFLFFSDKPVKQFSAAQITIVPPIIKGNASLKYWYDVKLAEAAKKCKADVLINFGDACSLGTKIPQVLLVKDLAIVHHSKWFSKSAVFFHNFFQKKFIAKARHLITLSECIKQEIIAHYKTSPEKIAVVSPVANSHFAPISFDEREAIKDAYANGREYFLFVGSTSERDNLINGLKAFSIFKKWQQSSMKLLVAGKMNKEFVEKLKTYKYREDVTILDEITNEKYTELMTAAYVLVYPSLYEGVGLPVIEAMQSGVSVITSDNTALAEIAADTAFFVNPSEVDEIANQMKLLYRDENLRSQLIQRGLVQAEKFSWDKSASAFMKIIESAASK